MPYASVADFVTEVGEPEARLLAPVPVSGGTPPVAGGPTWDDVRVADALADASSMLDTYLASRYPVPIANPPRVLVKSAIDLAREQLDRTGRAPVIAAAARARAWATDIARGMATLNQGDPAGPPPPPSSGGSAVRPGRATFSDDELDGYMPRFAAGGARHGGGWGR